MIRRAGVRPSYTKGFHPKPEMSLSPALSVGVASLGEYVDIKLIDAPPSASLIQRLNQASCGGLVFTDAAPLEADDRALGSVIDGARYLIAFPEEALASLGGLAILQERIRALMAATSVHVERMVKGAVRQIEVRKLLRQLRLGGERAAQLLGRVQLEGDLLALEAEVRILATGALRPRDLVAALTGTPDWPHRAVRTELLAGNATPLDLEQIRAASGSR